MPYHPQVQAIWDQLERDHVPSLYTLSLQEARAADLAAVTAGAGQGEPVAEVTDLRIPGPGGELPVRVYRPDGATGRGRCWRTSSAAAGPWAPWTPVMASADGSPTQQGA